MASLTPRDKRILRIAGIAIALYLILFYGVRGLLALEASRARYAQLVQKVRGLGLEAQQYENKVLKLEKLKKASRIELAGLQRDSLAGDASGAIQRAAQSSGIKLGPVRESPGSSTGKELAAMQLEATGPIPGALSLLHRLDTLGFPLVVDSLQIDPDSRKPGEVKLILRVVLLDIDHWRKKEKPNA